jgi:hypothetical protein
MKQDKSSGSHRPQQGCRPGTLWGEGPPMVVIQVQPMAGEPSKPTVNSSDTVDEGEEDHIQTDRVSS